MESKQSEPGRTGALLVLLVLGFSSPSSANDTMTISQTGLSSHSSCSRQGLDQYVGRSSPDDPVKAYRKRLSQYISLWSDSGGIRSLAELLHPEFEYNGQSGRTRGIGAFEELLGKISNAFSVRCLEIVDVSPHVALWDLKGYGDSAVEEQMREPVYSLNKKEKQFSLRGKFTFQQNHFLPGFDSLGTVQGVFHKQITFDAEGKITQDDSYARLFRLGSFAAADFFEFSEDISDLQCNFDRDKPEGSKKSQKLTADIKQDLIEALGLSPGVSTEDLINAGISNPQYAEKAILLTLSLWGEVWNKRQVEGKPSGFFSITSPVSFSYADSYTPDTLDNDQLYTTGRKRIYLAAFLKGYFDQYNHQCWHFKSIVKHKKPGHYSIRYQFNFGREAGVTNSVGEAHEHIVISDTGKIIYADVYPRFQRLPLPEMVEDAALLVGIDSGDIHQWSMFKWFTGPFGFGKSQQQHYRDLTPVGEVDYLLSRY